MAFRATDVRARYSTLLDLRSRGQNRYLLVSIKKGVAFARWSDQLNCGSKINDANIKGIIENVRLRENEGNLEILDFKGVYYSRGSKSDKDNLESVSKALDEYGVVSLPARLINPSFRMEGPAPYEKNGISLLSPDRMDQTTPGCFICGGEERNYYSITGWVDSENDYFALANMFGGRGIAVNQFGLGLNAWIKKEGKGKPPINNFPVYIGACHDHLSVQGWLREYSVLHPQLITKEIMELLIAYNDPEKMDPINKFGVNVEWAKKLAADDVQVGFRFF